MPVAFSFEISKKLFCLETVCQRLVGSYYVVSILFIDLTAINLWNGMTNMTFKMSKKIYLSGLFLFVFDIPGVEFKARISFFASCIATWTQETKC